MSRVFISLLTLTVLLASCTNQGNKSGSAQRAADNAAKVNFAALSANPDEYVGKNIIVQGKVVHVCVNSGKKLFITGDNPDVMLFISAGENMPRFSTDLLGSEVEVEGLITKVGGPDSPAVENCETEKSLGEQPALANIVMEYKGHSVK